METEKSKSYTVRIYIGHGAAGAEKHKALTQKAQSLNLKMSRFILDTIKKAYPRLPL